MSCEPLTTFTPTLSSSVQGQIPIIEMKQHSSVLTILCLDIHPQIQRDRKYSSCWTKAIHCNYNIRSLCSSEMLNSVDWQLVLLGLFDPQRLECPKTTVTIYQSMLKEHRSHLHCGRSQRLYNIELHTFWGRGI